MTVKEKIEHKHKIAARNIAVLIISAALLGLVLFIALNTGYSKLPFDAIMSTLLGKGTDKQELLIFTIRMPRVVICALIGAGLSLSGCVIQGVTRNPLADAGLLGISSGGGLMVVLYVLLVGTASHISIFTLPFLSLIGAGTAAIAVYALAYKNKEGITPTRLVLTGVAVQAGLSALMTVLVVKLDDTQYDFVASWQAGQIWGGNWMFVLAVLPWILLLTPYVCYKARNLDVLNLGDETATGLGLRVEQERRKLLAASVALAACSVAVGGNISFVGLISPHLTRRLVGPRHALLLPACALIGAVLVSVADTIGRAVIAPSAIPTGIMTAIIGAPYFIYLLVKSK